MSECKHKFKYRDQDQPGVEWCSKCGEVFKIKEAPMEQVKTWPCEHVSERDGVWVYWINKLTLHHQTVSKWSHCPECGARCPDPRTALWQIFKNYEWSDYNTGMKVLANAALDAVLEVVESMDITILNAAEVIDKDELKRRLEELRAE